HGFLILQMNLTRNVKRHLAEGTLTRSDRVENDEIQKRRRQEPIGSDFKLIFIDRIQAGVHGHGHGDHFGRRTDCPGYTGRRVLLECSDHIEWYREFEGILQVWQQGYDISRRHWNIGWPGGQVRMSERINAISVHVGDGSVRAPADISADQLNINR